ncbi:MAG: TolC family protein [Bacteroidota bacterium]
MKNKYFLYIILFLSVNGFAQESLTLQQAIETGLKNNYSIIIQRNEAAKAVNNYTPGNAGMLPRLDATVIQNNTITDTRQEYTTGNIIDRNGATASSLNADGALTWTVFDGFTMFASYNKLKELQKAGDINARMTIEDALQQIIASYFDVVKQQTLLQVIDSSRKISDIKLNIAKTRFEIGAASKLDYLQAQVDRNADESLYKKQIVTIAESKIRLNQLLARKVDTDFFPADSIIASSPAELDQSLSKALSDNSQLKIAGSNLEIARLTIREWKGQRWPTIDLNAGYNYSQSSSEASLVQENKSNGLNYGFTVRWNLFNGFTLNSIIKNAKLDYNSYMIRLDEIKSSVDAETRIAWQQLRSNLEIVTLEQQNALLAKENINLAIERFRVGLTDELQLKEAQQSYTEALNRLVGVQYDARISQTTLQRITGTLIQ